ncbi:copper resistance D family protein [Paenibacillus sp. SGZ-1009]|uniref:copper resistance D family protein n=1 Tax=Paenibacillus campi TaxID=3106031 RepID=UPI002AFDFD57|nr:CopD family protein [Paenibacillus sp. SGZ-1009]
MLYGMMLADLLLYVCLSLVVGRLLLGIMQPDQQPGIDMPRKWLIGMIIGMMILAAMPMIQVIVFFVTEFDYKIGFVLAYVLGSYNAGHGWLMTVICGLLLIIVLGQRVGTSRPRSLSAIGIVLAIGMLAGIGYTSHSASLYGWSGFITHSVHLLAVTLWLGVLFVVAWFTKRPGNWQTWLGWMSPFAMICYVAAIASGLLMMLSFTDNYAGSLAVPFGQALLIKHALLLPLTALAATNGFVLKWRLAQQPQFNPLRWLRIETVFALLVLLGTAYLSNQSPPHDLVPALESKAIALSPLWTLFYEPFAQVVAYGWLHLNGSFIGICAALLAIILVVAGILLLVRCRSIWTTIGLLVCSAISLYTAVMLSVHL